MRIGFLASHPGSVNSLLPLINRFKELGEEVFLFPLSGYALHLWKGENLYLDNKQQMKFIPRNLDFLFYCPIGTSEIENSLPDFCKKHRIISVATIDIFWSSSEHLRFRFSSEPDFIIAPDYGTAKELNELNLISKVLPLGNPHFEQYQSRNRKGITKSPVNKEVIDISFISFPSCNKEVSPTAPLAITLLQRLYDSLIEFATNGINNINAIDLNICLHPRESSTSYTSVIEHLKYNYKINVILHKNKTTSIICKSSDIIVGYNSTVLIEELLNGKAVLYLNEDTDLRNIFKSKESLMSSFNKPPYKVDLPRNVIDNIVDFTYTNAPQPLYYQR